MFAAYIVFSHSMMIPRYTRVNPMRVAGLFLFTVYLSSGEASTENYLEVSITAPVGRDIVRKIGDSLSLNCTVTDGGPPDTITWFKDGILLNATTKDVQWVVKRIEKIGQDDGGYYKCVAKHAQQSQETTVYVNIEGKPVIIDCCETSRFTRSPVWPNVGALFQKLLCFATGSPLPLLQWFKNGKQIKNGKGGFYLTKENYGLTLSMITQQKNSGKYTCQATNERGTDNRTITVKIRVPDIPLDPTITTTSSVVHAFVGDSNVTLACIGENVKEVDADTTWFFNGRELEEGSPNNSRIDFYHHYYDQNVLLKSKKVKMVLTINNATQSDGGKYTCQVTVLQKSVNKTIILSIEEKGETIPGKSGLNTSELISLTVGIMLFIVVAGAIVIFLHKKRKESLFPIADVPPGPYEYGAFITYNSKDYAWVEENLLPLLGKNDIEYCIHYRNFEIGIPIYQNIVNSVYKSRVVIVVMSPNYMKSKFCKTELDYAIHRAVEEHGSNPLIILRIDEKICKSKLPKAIKHKTFLDFSSKVERATWEKRLLEHIKSNDDAANENKEDDDDDTMATKALIDQQQDERKAGVV